MTRVSNSAGLRSAGEMVLQDPYLQYNYDGYQNNYAQQIPTKATGKIGSNFFKKPKQKDEDNKQDRLAGLLQLKKKLRHNELEEQGYFIRDEQREEKSREVILDQPIYEIFDAPNPNYRRQFDPSLDLRPIVGYQFHDPEFENNENLFVDADDLKYAQIGLENEQKKVYQKQFLLSRVNKSLKEHKDKELVQLRKQEKDEAVRRVIIGDQKQQKSKKQEIKKDSKIEKDIEWIERENKQSSYNLMSVGRKGRQVAVEPQTLTKSILSKSYQSLERKDKKVRFEEEPLEQVMIPKKTHRPSESTEKSKETKWRDKSSSFRDAIKAGRKPINK